MTPAEILQKIGGLSALVVGDICLDRWCTYDPAEGEPSRETGIPRIGVVETVVTPGAGGTVANNLAALGVGRIAVLGAIGDDGSGYELSHALAARGASSDLCVRSRAIQTFTYTKLLNATNQVEDQPRIDFINTRPLPVDVEHALLDRLPMAIEQHDVILIADQAETASGGVVTPAVRDAICDLALSYRDKIFFADSRTRVTEFRHVIAKPNQQEAEGASTRFCGRIDYPALRAHIAAPLLIVTHGGEGVELFTEDGAKWVKTTPEPNPVDICGAGDSFSAGMAMALAAGASPLEAARFGNIVASITIMKKGTGTASPAEVLAKA